MNPELPKLLTVLLRSTNVRHIPGGYLAVDTEDLRADVLVVLFNMGVIGLPVRVDSRAPTNSIVAMTDDETTGAP